MVESLRPHAIPPYGHGVNINQTNGKQRWTARASDYAIGYHEGTWYVIHAAHHWGILAQRQSMHVDHAHHLHTTSGGMSAGKWQVHTEWNGMAWHGMV